jgi:hypothetical protein
METLRSGCGDEAGKGSDMETTKEEIGRIEILLAQITKSPSRNAARKLLADAKRCAELEAEVERLRAGMEKLLAVVEAVEEHRLHLGPVGKDLDGERAPGGFIYVAGCWCKSCTAEAYRRMPDQARTGER